jgi:hypothetical protein
MISTDEPCPHTLAVLLEAFVLLEQVVLDVIKGPGAHDPLKAHQYGCPKEHVYGNPSNHAA